MSDVTPGLVPAPSPSVQAAPAVPPIPADPPAFSTVTATLPASAQNVVVTAPAFSTASTPGGNAGVSEYAGDLGASVSALIPAKVRAVIYPLGFLVSLAALALGMAHAIDPTAAGYIVLGAQAFTNGLAAGNVNKVG